ncbi:electron transfer flavoprotein subunit alpha/FixB family protein [Prosthecochloris sp. SCSIO W1102]|uniref:electron transfer flavoprotein subunit alpha/FixB family protein n=1 Tax=Prosthecochloris sp. SCSIO W1102 TaxID=2992243 RepID=UPI00223CD120|nr:electron transfer flavoprotein subunit alpha/FixB family protein [Prosthecochloris sp. SCSIO W1102]UZJ39077.1 electron transfer flavoprotein subunit alpha/FixB family protein [Prosthecochloris sp. SCSIO W1102]
MSFLVILEQRQGAVKKASVDVWHTVQHMAEVLGKTDFYGLVMGDVDKNVISSRCGGKGRIYMLNDAAFHDYCPECYAGAIVEMAGHTNAENIFFANTAMGKDLAPRIAIRLDAALASDCVVGLDGNGLLKAVTTMYAGTVSAVVENLRKRAVYTVAPRSYSFEGLCENDVEILEGKGECLSKSNPVLKGVIYNKGRKDITESDILIAGGRGVGSSENFALLESLATSLGGVVGASRSAVDEGWRPHSDQIGQTGRSVAPRLYIACGISGAPQHLAGIAGAETVIAINRDREAPIFKVADYGIVGDITEVVPLLEKAVCDFQRMK